VQRDVQSVLALHNAEHPDGCTGSPPVISGVKVPMGEPSVAKGSDAAHPQLDPDPSSEPDELIVTISDASATDTCCSTVV
jgi:hypothetical protein